DLASERTLFQVLSKEGGGTKIKIEKYLDCLGQNFLFDKNHLHKIVACCPVDDKIIIIEIGSGYGNLTNLLAKTDCQKVIGIEKDSQLFQWLIENNKNEKIIYHHQDALKIN
ncbi:32641_t:CDS:2, partial [Racocetra persica]